MPLLPLVIDNKISNMTEVIDNMQVIEWEQ